MANVILFEEYFGADDIVFVVGQTNKGSILLSWMELSSLKTVMRKVLSFCSIFPGVIVYFHWKISL